MSTSHLTLRTLRQKTESLGERMALITVIDTEGSTFRKPGAQMLVTSSGFKGGMIGGGCFDGPLVEIAQDCIAKNTRGVFAFDTREESDVIFGSQLGCQGKTVVWVEPLEPQLTPDETDLFFGESFQRQDQMIGFIVSAPARLQAYVGRRFRIEPSLIKDSSHNYLHLIGAKLTQNRTFSTLVQKKKSSLVNIMDGADTLKIFVSYRQADTRLRICGSGEDASLVAKVAATTGVYVELIDRRDGPAFLELKNTPSIELCRQDPALQLTKSLSRPEDAILIMSHRLSDDEQSLRAAFDLNPMPFYIGLLGPAARRDRLLNALGGLPEKYPHLYAPCGLNINTDSPESLALSIVAEIMSVRKNGGVPPEHLSFPTMHAVLSAQRISH